ncbi:23S rRNA (uracil(747)-C(5))-methyltransferase RlmC [Serratia plymuthica]|nr:23S rRNA (uracil(747)-C(5))-methyltransferase RlmC [Serratia plymuthica]
MHCALYTAGTCRSCQWLEKPYLQQLTDKQHHLQSLLAGRDVAQWLEPLAGEQSAFRNKAKMVVSGSVERPLLGMLHRDGTPVDLGACPLYPASFEPMFVVLKSFIARAGLTPYNVARKRGELKYLLLTESTHSGGVMLRFVLRSDSKLAQLRAALPWLQQQLPQLRVISANIQPVHMAIMEGEREIPLTEQQALEEQFNQVPLYIRPQSFFQTNPQVAAKLYATARDWVRALVSTACGICSAAWAGLACTAHSRKPGSPALKSAPKPLPAHASRRKRWVCSTSVSRRWTPRVLPPLKAVCRSWCWSIRHGAVSARRCAIT